MAALRLMSSKSMVGPENVSVVGRGVYARDFSGKSAETPYFRGKITPYFHLCPLIACNY